jgi:hypothetical protein
MSMCEYRDCKTKKANFWVHSTGPDNYNLIVCNRHLAKTVIDLSKDRDWTAHVKMRHTNDKGWDYWK